MHVPQVRTISVDPVSCMFSHSIVVTMLHSFPFLALLIGLLHIDFMHISLLAMMLNSFLCTMYSICFLFSEISSELLFSVWLTLLMLSSEFLAYCRHKSFTIWMSCQRLLSVFLYRYTVMIKEERKTFFLKNSLQFT